MLKIDYCSDLHIGTTNPTPDWAALKNSGSEILIVAGDITNNDYLSSWGELEKASQHYASVLFVDGNHEHYDSGMGISELEEFYKYKCIGTNINYLSSINAYISIKGHIAIVGVNGWYDWQVSGIDQLTSGIAWRKYMNDSRLIEHGDKLPPVRAKEHMQQLTHNVTCIPDHYNIIVVTHTAPSESLLSHEYNRELNGSYCNSMMEGLFNNSNISHWVYGHTHQRTDTTIGNIQFHANCRGYGREFSEPFTLKQLIIG